MAKPAHRMGDYKTRAKQCTDQAYGNPATRCWRCGLTLGQILRAWAATPRRKRGARPTWHAGHLVDGQAGGALRAECSACNCSAGGKLGARRRRRERRTSLTW